MSFSASILKFGPEAVGRINTIRRQVCLKLFSSVIKDTPVDTGRLRANWQLTEGTPAVGEVQTLDTSGGPTIAKLKAPIEASTGDTELFLTNNLPYASRIEFEGWSHTKAPEGMVRRNVVRFGRLIKIELNK